MRSPPDGKRNPSDWHALQWMAASRVAVALALALFGVADDLRSGSGWISNPDLFTPASTAYLIVAVLFVAGVRLLRGRMLRHQLVVHALADLVAIALLMHSARGISGGLGVLMIAPVAAAAVLATPRLAAFFAAVGTLLLLGEAGLAWLRGDPAQSALVMVAGLIGAACFATALLVNWLAMQLRRQESIASERGENLRNQLAVTQLVVAELEQGVLVMAPNGSVRTMNPAARRLLSVGERGHASVALGQVARACALWRGEGAPAGDAQDLLLAGPPALRGAPPTQVRALLRLFPTPGGDAVLMLDDLRQAEERAQQLKLASMGRLSASIAHEIRNPLGAIRHANALLGERLAEETNQRLSRIIEDNTLRIDRIIGDVLSVSRRERPVQEEIDVAAFLPAFADEFALQANVPRERIDVQVQSASLMCFDANHLRQVLVNLAGNALRYASGKPGSVTLQWRLRRLDRLELRIADDGPGLSAEMQQHVFEPFFTTEARGTGLGLYLARELCAANGALLRYEPAGDAAGAFVIEPRATGAAHAPDADS